MSEARALRVTPGLPGQKYSAVDNLTVRALPRSRTIGFVIAFSTFLVGCVDYSVIRQSHSLSEVVVPRCVST